MKIQIFWRKKDRHYYFCGVRNNERDAIPAITKEMFNTDQSKNAVKRRRIVFSTSLTRRLIGRLSETAERFHHWSTVSILFFAAL